GSNAIDALHPNPQPARASSWRHEKNDQQLRVSPTHVAMQQPTRGRSPISCYGPRSIGARHLDTTAIAPYTDLWCGCPQMVRRNCVVAGLLLDFTSAGGLPWTRARSNGRSTPVAMQS